MIRKLLDCVWLSILSVILAFAILGLIATCTKARDLGQWEQTDPATKRWFQSLRQPDNPIMSCCGEADAYWADGMVVENGRMFAIITDDRPDEPLGRAHIPPGTRIEIPPNKIMQEGGNPTGHFVVFIGPTGVVYCYVSGSLG